MQFYSDASSNENTGCKGSSRKRMGKLEKIPAWQLTKVRNKNEVISEARNESRKVLFASLMDLCHLKNSELEPQFQECKAQLCLAGHARKTSMEKPVARLMISSLSLHVSWKPVNPQECVWKNLYQNIMLQEKGTIHYNITIWYTNFSYASSHEDSRCKGSGGQGMGNIEEIFGVEPDESHK